MAQAWFSGGPTSPSPAASDQPSLLAEWNSYAAKSDADDAGGSSLGFDLEAAVRTANDKVSGTFNVVSKGVRELPGSLQSATSSVPSGKSLMYFGLLLATGVFFIFIAFFMFLPMMVLMPQKFAICFTLGCMFIIASFFALKGPRNQFAHMSSRETSFHFGVYWQHGGHHLCIHVSAQLYPLSFLLCDTGACAIILCYFILPWGICWTEVPVINYNLFDIELFWQVICVCCVVSLLNLRCNFGELKNSLSHIHFLEHMNYYPFWCFQLLVLSCLY
ncbi:hypothetical protein QJS10_CPA08g01850 [Acorus calamus]|uniref:Vesicle transport protein n=1 Tax=Acorus calamus TaxID=4465 RepID=A0AAV9ECK5_ACOCL|nr:hypothetical protein QJS10_CPA08g01850 [Acorus calamus]